MSEESLDEIGCITESGKQLLKQFQNGLLRIIILWIISKNSIHGYGISKELDGFFNSFNKSDNKINPAKLYPILRKMEDNSLIESVESVNNNKKVKFYQITDNGEDLLNFIGKKWALLVDDECWMSFLEDMMSKK